MLKVPVYTIKGTKKGEFSLPKEYGLEVNLNLLAQANHVLNSRAHVGLRNTKTRSEVNRTTKKVYKQKGTGGARHGSRRANLFVGGGIIFGPRPLKRILSLSGAVKRKAKLMSVSAKAQNKEMVLVEGINKADKTKVFGELVAKLAKETGFGKFTFVLSDKNLQSLKFIKNLKLASPIMFKDANALDYLSGGLIVMDEGVFGGSEKQKAKSEKTKTK